ncbi:DUF4377 domain-containing protein [Spirosoma aureum]|uniref:DUF4377 domain-containing protein n=1 Tax=Spirosoma aureum TaxID=2692134 RepID=A0A6G9ASF9_9BACT|nr:DUF4377 domain-containing protein [Spirosoma aureum]QIP15259.1 DUF4377 domain-containing protein [Spirosoma aureum]
MKRVFSLGFLLLVFFSCDKNTVKPAIVEMQIADHQQDCMGVAPQKCLLVKVDNDTSWQLFYGNIEGFSYEAGFEYKLLVKREKIDNPPADSSDLRYSLVKVVEKNKT